MSDQSRSADYGYRVLRFDDEDLVEPVAVTPVFEDADADALIAGYDGPMGSLAERDTHALKGGAATSEDDFWRPEWGNPEAPGSSWPEPPDYGYRQIDLSADTKPPPTSISRPMPRVRVALPRARRSVCGARRRPGGRRTRAAARAGPSGSDSDLADLPSRGRP